MSTNLIRFQIETQRVIQLLAKQIYQSPLALLRENTQNSFDAIRQRIASGDDFAPRIDIQLRPDKVEICDNGIGMTQRDLREHYWTAGKSSKNNESARAAGVVGTFGIGAMANFGIADTLEVETESAATGERTICRAEKATLSLTEDCIECQSIPSLHRPGTKVIANIGKDASLDVVQARSYIAEFVSLVDVPVYVNGDLVSQRSIDEIVPKVPEAWSTSGEREKLGQRLTADVELVLSNNADVWLKLTNIMWAEKKLSGKIVLRTGQANMRTFRSGFGLATTLVNSTYQFGGVVDLLVLEPTAGREAITVDGVQFLQSIMIEIDAYISKKLSERDECDSSTPFMQWVIAHNRYDLCGRLRMSITPGDKIALGELKHNAFNFYEGADQGLIRMQASEESPLLILARSNPRRRCEQNYLRLYTKAKPVSDKPVVKDRRAGSHLNAEESSLAFRIETILESDYFLESKVELGIISHGLPILAEKRKNDVLITLNPEGQTVKQLLGIYKTEFAAFGSMVKDFVRSIIFPRISDYVPSSTRQGAEAFLNAIKRPRELFEYADGDLDSLPTIWSDYDEGRITLDVAIERSKAAARSSVQVVDRADRASDVVPDVIQNEQVFQNAAVESALDLEPAPAITRQEVSSAAKLLIINENEPALRGYRCFLAITDKVREEMGEFFLQPHRTSVVWGGQKTLFIFLHHSGQFGLYYDLQTKEPVDAPAGGGNFPTATIVLKDRLFIPIPEAIMKSFVPVIGERKRFEVRGDILRTDSSESK